MGLLDASGRALHSIGSKIILRIFMRAQTSFERLSGTTCRQWFSYSLFVLRLAVGIEFLMAGLAKMSDWSAAGFLSGATGPLAGWFQSMAGNPLVDFLNVWGLTLVGVAMILGLLVRPAALAGASMMVLYYLADFEGNTAHGFIDQHIILALIFVVFLSGGVGHVFGLDGLAKEHFRKAGRMINILFG